MRGFVRHVASGGCEADPYISDLGDRHDAQKLLAVRLTFCAVSEQNGQWYFRATLFAVLAPSYAP